MPLPNPDDWEHREPPEPMLGFVFRCQGCNEICQAKWSDYGPVLCTGQEHAWGWRSTCCGEAFYETNE